MKKIVILLCAVTLFFVACNKDDDNPSPANPVNPVNPVDPSDTTQVDPLTDGLIPNAVTDIDGNSYDAVRIGNQVWMASNLRTTRFANGEEIPEGQPTTSTEPYRFTLNTDEAEYGYLYNWTAVMHGAESSAANPSGVQGVCPDGWHVPSDEEWTQLTDYVKSHSEYVCSGTARNIAKALAGDHGWQINNDEECAVGNNQSSNNSTGFSALPAGFCNGGGYGYFGVNAYFWSTTELSSTNVYTRTLYYDSALVDRSNYPKATGISVRCVRD